MSAKTSSSPTLLLFPGLGVNERLFLPQQSLPFNIIVPPWIDPMEFESVPHYAWRLTRELRLDPENLWIGGMSFGGMVALEAAKLLKPRGVILLAATRRGSAHSPMLRLLSWIVPEMSLEMIRLGLMSAPLIVRVVGRPNRSQRKLLLQLVDDGHLALTRWGSRAIMNYTFTGKLACPVLQINGEIDRLVPINNIKPDVVVKGAGHVVNVTHARIVNDLIRKMILGDRAADGNSILAADAD